MTSWHRKLTLQHIEASRPLRLIFDNGRAIDMETGDVLEFPFDVPYRYSGEREGRSIVEIDGDVQLVGTQSYEKRF